MGFEDEVEQSLGRPCRQATVGPSRLANSPHPSSREGHHYTARCNLLFRWFVGPSADDPVWDATVFCKNRDRLLDGDIAAKFFAGVLNLPQVRKVLSSAHFSVDGTLIEAWASMKSFVPKDGGDPPPGKDGGRGGRNAERDFRGEKRTNDTHCSTTTRTRDCFAKASARKPNSVTWAM